MATILYLGDSNSGSTSRHRIDALKRLGHTVLLHDPYRAESGVLASGWRGTIDYHTGYRLLQPKVVRWVNAVLRAIEKPDLVWIDSGELFGRKSTRLVKRLGCPVVLYNVDDPTGKRDGHKFDSLIQAMPLYDLAVVVRKETEEECRALGVRQVMRVYRSYDEVAHHPFRDPADIPPQYRSEVVFVGTWMRHEKRDEFLLELIRQGVPLSIWGNRWRKSPYWHMLQSAYRGESLSGRDYVAAIQGAKLCIGLLSKGNRDLHTQRSLEVPFAGGLLCAERTTEHLDLYQDGTEAVFWSNAAECAQVCKQLLMDDARRERIRFAGMHRVRALGVGNEDICRKVLDQALNTPELQQPRFLR